MKNKIWTQIFIIYLRYILGFAFILASIVKIQGLRFTTENGIENPINSAWHFFETLYQSGIYWRFIGLAQFISGLLLMTQRYAKIGAIFFFPIILNAFMITVSYNFHGTQLITSLMLLGTLLLLFWDWDSLKILFNKIPTNYTTKRLEYDNVWVYLGFVLLIITLVSKLLIDNQNVFIYVFIAMFIIGIIGLYIGLKKTNTNSNDDSL